MYNQTSRYYNVDDETDIPQSHLFRTYYKYSTTVVTEFEADRLDLVSQRVYNTPVNWWIIARFNAIINPNVVPAGTQLKIPLL